MIDIKSLIQKIDDDTAIHSGLKQKQNHLGYKEIIKLGKAAIPEILESLEEKPTWTAIMLLSELSGVDRPEIPNEHRGKFFEVVKIWIDWGKSFAV